MKKTNHIKVICVVLVGAVAMAGYLAESYIDAPLADYGTVLAGDEEGLISDRALRRWEAIVEDDFTFVHSFYTPAYRKLYTPMDTASQYGGQVQRVKVDITGVAIEGIKATVSYKIDVIAQIDGVEVLMPHFGRELWLKKRTMWWYYEDAAPGQ